MLTSVNTSAFLLLQILSYFPPILHAGGNGWYYTMAFLMKLKFTAFF